MEIELNNIYSTSLKLFTIIKEEYNVFLTDEQKIKIENIDIFHFYKIIKDKDLPPIYYLKDMYYLNSYYNMDFIDYLPFICLSYLCNNLNPLKIGLIELELKQLKDKYALQSVINMIDKSILEKAFPDEIESAKTYASSLIDSMVDQYGDKQQLLQAIQYYTNYSSIEAYQDYIYLSQLQSHAAEEYAKTQITNKEIKKYYNDEVKGDIEVNHILIAPSVNSDASETEKTEAEDAAKVKVDEIINILNTAKDNKEDVKAKFEELAREYSLDTSTKENGGSLGRINQDTLGEEYAELVDAAYKLKDGEYSKEVITTELGYEIIYRSSSYDKKSLDEMRDSIIEKLAKKLVEDDATVSINALKYYRDSYNMKIEDSELSKQYELYIKNALSQASKNDSEN